MAKINYKISTKINKNGESEILMDIQPERGVHYRMKTGVWVTPENFERLTRADKITSIDYLGVLESRLYDAFPCDKEKALKILDGIRDSDNILALYDKFTSERMIEKGLADGTRDMYKNVKVVLEGCLDGRKSVKTINTIFLNEMIEYMCEKGYSNTTQLNYWRLFKVFLTYLVKNNMVDQKLLLYKPKFRMVENDVVFLSHNELYRMMGLELKGKKKMIRDTFVVQCMTGMRYSDMVNVRKENIREDTNGKYISILTKKTLQRLKIYLNTNVCEILETYDWTLPHFSDDTVNSNLPVIAKMAHIDSDVENIKFVGNKRIVEHKHKWECIKTHTARRTFICLCIEKGISTPVIQSITGHKQLSSFERYVGIGDKSKSDVVTKLEI